MQENGSGEEMGSGKCEGRKTLFLTLENLKEMPRMKLKQTIEVREIDDKFRKQHPLVCISE